MQLFLGKLGWRPRDFWGATPKELASIIGSNQSQPPLTGEALQNLMKQYPDKQECSRA
ncbi:phage tail assembly chaperone [Rhodobacteraceae bacterium RKSG542]|nr:phage tail assembly chaperone [Pseudovibrio flavus]